MTYKDFVYGEIEIKEPVLIELINCPTIQRLKKVDLGGHPPLWAKNKTSASNIEHSRFNHSVGVMILLKKYGASTEEQIAGLIHDASHSAFSHAIDYVMKEGTIEDQSHQDNMTEEYLRKSEIPKILDEYGFDMDYILDDSNFPLKENSVPDICADRIDYCLRGSLFFKETERNEIEYILKNLKTEGGTWFFENFESAKKFAEIFETMNKIYYSGKDSAYMFIVTSDYLRYALNKKYITQDDLYSTDKGLLEKVNKNLDDPVLKKYWDRMNDKNLAENNVDDYDIETICKSRIVDPLFKNGGKIKKVSDKDRGWKKVVEEELKPKKYFLKFKN